MEMGDILLMGGLGLLGMVGFEFAKQQGWLNFGVALAGARPGGTAQKSAPTTQPGTSSPPAQQASTGTAQPTPELGYGIDFWSDKFDYHVGEPIHLDGWVWSWDGQTALRLPGREVQIVDPDAGDEAWHSTKTDQDGYWSIVYTGQEFTPWRSYAVDVASGARTGNLTFRPQIPEGWVIT